MGRRTVAIDLFDDPPWPTDVPARKPLLSSARPLLVASLVLVAVVLGSTALPWSTSAETPAWTPYAHGLDVGGGPGTQDWGFLVAAITVATALATVAALHRPGPVRIGASLVGLSALVATTVPDLFAHLTVDPGPSLDAAYGAWIGTVAGMLAWLCAAGALPVDRVTR
jgi:hypothetical protein